MTRNFQILEEKQIAFLKTKFLLQSQINEGGRVKSRVNETWGSGEQTVREIVGDKIQCVRVTEKWEKSKETKERGVIDAEGGRDTRAIREKEGKKHFSILKKMSSSLEENPQKLIPPPKMFTILIKMGPIYLSSAKKWIKF